MKLAMSTNNLCKVWWGKTVTTPPTYRRGEKNLNNLCNNCEMKTLKF